MRMSRAFLIFSYGLFTITAQSLLFREFITTFEGNDISVGIFFGTWFLWVALGAALVYRAKTFAEKLLKNIEFLLLAFLPAFILEWILIVQARELAGVESYALLSIRAILLLSIVINAPVSIITGLFFPIACRWIRPVRNPITTDYTDFTDDNPDQKHVVSNGVKQEASFAVSRVYIIEAAGSFLGGTGATILLGLGVSSARIFFILAFILSLSIVWVRLIKARRWAWIFVPVFILVSLVAGADNYLSQQIRIIKWNKLLPQGRLKGSFQTAQAEYLYGDYQGQWVAIRQSSTCEVLPDKESAGRIAAIGLCQNPDAKSILVIGTGLGLCRQLLRLPQIETVTWAHCDNGYVQKINTFIPEKFRINDKRFQAETSDIRSLLNEKKKYPVLSRGLSHPLWEVEGYDIAIINLPDATSSVLNRYYTLEFYSQIKEVLRPNGVLAVRVAGGENVMGTELINLGASTKLTLQNVFSHLVLIPGEDTWFIASDSESLTGRPGILRDRFEAIEGGVDVFPPQALLSVYLPDKADAALKKYAGADLPESLLINRDAKPLTHLYSLLLTAKQSGASVTRLVKYLALTGPVVFVVPILVFVILRIIYVSSCVPSAALRTGVRRASPRLRSGQAYENLNTIRNTQYAIRNMSFDSSFLIFSAGLVGIGVVIVLMYIYQTHFGSLYLYIGIISSLFMVGLTAGAILSSYFVGTLKRTSYLVSLVFAVVIAHALILAAIAFWPDQSAAGGTHLTFAIVFVSCGVFAGCYFPLVAKLLSSSAFETGQIGSKLETADHIGASVGGLFTGLVLVPVLGTKVTFFVFMLLLLTNVPLFALRMYKPKGLDSASSPRAGFVIADVKFQMRRLGYILFGVGLSVIICSNLLSYVSARLSPSLPLHSAQALAGDLHLEHSTGSLSGKSAVLNDPTGRTQNINYFTVSNAHNELTGYIFSSEELAPEVRGFGGKINLAIYVDPNGTLIDFHIIRSSETPAYLEMLRGWCELLNGRHLFETQPFANVDAVTGATISSKAILSALESSGHRFAAQILDQSRKPASAQRTHLANYLPDTNGIYLITVSVLALIVTYRGGFWSRLTVLVLTLVIGGFVLNAQYSSEQIATILSLHVPAIRLSGAFLSVVGIPLLVILFGNIYCGYICPFGAAQELLSYIVPQRFKHPITVDNMRKARFIKYVVLFVLIIAFFVSRNRTTLAADPLISFFNLRFWSAIGGLMLVVVMLALIGSVFYTRFWCRYLCPAGAFLSLLNNIVVLRRFLPAKRFAKCEFGLTARDHLDCIYCDRCRYKRQKPVLSEVEGTEDRKQKTEDRRQNAVMQYARRKTQYEIAPFKLLSRYFVVVVLIIGILISAVSISRFLQVTPSSLSQPAASISSGGQPRDVDLQRVRRLIEQKRLSDREAEFYKKME